MKTAPPIYGLLAEFEGPVQLLEAARRTRDAGYKRIDAYSPYPVEGLTHALGHCHRNRLPHLVLAGGLTGLVAGTGMQWFASAVHYPINVGGRPLFGWPAAIPIAFETTVLFAALTAVFAMLALNGLPMPYHPLFNVDRFALASRDRFFLCIEATDPKFDRAETRRFLESLRPAGVNEVAH